MFAGRFTETDLRLKAMIDQDPLAAINAARELRVDDVLNQRAIDMLAAGTFSRPTEQPVDGDAPGAADAARAAAGRIPLACGGQGPAQMPRGGATSRPLKIRSCCSWWSGSRAAA